MSLILNILHFNDVYRVTKQKTDDGEIDVSQWAAMLNKRREEWPERSDGKRDGLVLFSGDVFSPSVESSVTRGSHMVYSSPIVIHSLQISRMLKGASYERYCSRLFGRWKSRF